MDLCNLAWLRAPLVAVVVAAAAAPACHSNNAGGRPTDAGRDLVPELVEKLSPPDAYCAPDAIGGGGVCPLNFCGQVKSVAVLGAGETASTGADALCTPGYACVPAGPTTAGTALQLRCVTPQAGALEFGKPCSKDPAAGMRCADDALCVDAPGTTGMPFCTALCRADSDCPNDAYCLEYKSATLPNGSYATLGMCTTKEKLGGTRCAREADCLPGQGCVFYGARTSLLICKAVGGAKAIGAACASNAECRSGECYDRDGHVNGGANRTFCAGVCTKNSDCGADQRCVRVVVSNNGTLDEPRDDVVAGYCQTLFVAVKTAGCMNDGKCPAGTTCDTNYGLCHKAGAVTGAPCAADTDCDLGATCLMGPRFPGGYCQGQGCAAGVTTGADACAGAESVCSQRASNEPIFACYEGCAQAGDCSRFASGYTCDAPKNGQPNSICLGMGAP